MSRLSSRIKTKAISKKILEDPSTNRAFLRLAELLMEIAHDSNPVDPPDDIECEQVQPTSIKKSTLTPSSILYARNKQKF